jgi:hypothetical protein
LEFGDERLKRRLADAEEDDDVGHKEAIVAGEEDVVELRLGDNRLGFLAVWERYREGEQKAVDRQANESLDRGRERRIEGDEPDGKE